MVEVCIFTGKSPQVDPETFVFSLMAEYSGSYPTVWRVIDMVVVTSLVIAYILLFFGKPFFRHPKWLKARGTNGQTLKKVPVFITMYISLSLFSVTLICKTRWDRRMDGQTDAISVASKVDPLDSNRLAAVRL